MMSFILTLSVNYCNKKIKYKGIIMDADHCPLISVLTPTWNRASYLKSVWSGLNRQSYKNIEWIIANDGSTDNTRTVVSELAKVSNFPVIFIDASMRIGKPRMDNELMRAAKGEFLIWNDSDDYLLDDAIGSMVASWTEIPEEKRNEYLGVIGLCIDKNGNAQTLGHVNNKLATDITWKALMKEIIGDGTIMVRSDLVKNKKFLEVDFLITESSFWQPIFSNLRAIQLPDIVKIMDRSAPGSISFGNKMEYNRGKVYAISLADIGDHFYRKKIKERVWKAINYWRYSILGEVGFLKAISMWDVVSDNYTYLLLYPVGFLLAIRDKMSGKVVMTHRDFEYAKDHVTIKTIKYEPSI